jgi:hypothetical protein
MKTKKWPPIDPGTRVQTTQPNMEKRDEWTDEGWADKKWGVKGQILTHHDSHGLCYDVLHEDGTQGCYDPSELEVIQKEETFTYKYGNMDVSFFENGGCGVAYSPGSKLPSMRWDGPVIDKLYFVPEDDSAGSALGALYAVHRLEADASECGNTALEQILAKAFNHGRAYQRKLARKKHARRTEKKQQKK